MSTPQGCYAAGMPAQPTTTDVAVVPLPEHRLAAALIRAALAGTTDRREIEARWPAGSDRDLRITRRSLRLWFRRSPRRNVALRARLRARLEHEARALETGEGLRSSGLGGPMPHLWIVREYLLGLLGS